MNPVRSAILTYHSLDNSDSVISVRPEIFRTHVESLVDAGIRIVPLDSVQSEPGAVAIAFDDGFSNFADHALPVLERLNVPATLFVVSRYAGLTNDWPTQPKRVIPILPLLGWDDLRRLPENIAVGAHTATHQHLDRLGRAACENEIRECNDVILQRTGRYPRTFCYPYGDVSPAAAHFVQRHFQCGVRTRFDFVTADSDPFCLPRLDTFYFRRRPNLARLFSPAVLAYARLRNVARALRKRIAA